MNGIKILSIAAPTTTQHKDAYIALKSFNPRLAHGPSTHAYVASFRLGWKIDAPLEVHVNTSNLTNTVEWRPRIADADNADSRKNSKGRSASEKLAVLDQYHDILN